MDNENTQNESPQNAPMSTTPARKFNPVILIAVVVIVAAVGFAAVSMMGGRTQDSTQVVDSTLDESGAMTEEPVGTPVPAESEADVVVEMEGGNFYFKPNVVKAKVGDTVRINLTAVGMQHDVRIDELGVTSEIAQPGDTTGVEFVVDKAGEFEFYCSVGNHKAQGMVGTLIVEN